MAQNGQGRDQGHLLRVRCELRLTEDQRRGAKALSWLWLQGWGLAQGVPFPLQCRAPLPGQEQYPSQTSDTLIPLVLLSGLPQLGQQARPTPTPHPPPQNSLAED